MLPVNKELMFSYHDVCKLMCEACQLGVRDYASNGVFYHVLCGHDICCNANAWRMNDRVHKLLDVKAEVTKKEPENG